MTQHRSTKTFHCCQVFAAAAFDEHGDPIGEGVGDACKPVETLNPLPLPLCWAQLSRTALGLGHSSLAAQVRVSPCLDGLFSKVGCSLRRRTARACPSSAQGLPKQYRRQCRPSPRVAINNTRFPIRFVNKSAQVPFSNAGNFQSAANQAGHSLRA